MAKIAIDVVLIPSEKMMDKVIKINKELLKSNEKKIILNKEDCLPHISLCMGCFEEDKLLIVNKILEQISTKFNSFNLESLGIELEIIPTGKTVSGIIIKNQKELQKIHENIMENLWTHLSYDINSSMLFNPFEIEEVTLYWIKSYSKKYEDSSLFKPHITLGFGNASKFKVTKEFKASKLALCQLGNYCTCRKIINSWDLK